MPGGGKGKKRKRSVPLAAGAAPVHSLRRARRVTSRFHALERELEAECAAGRGKGSKAAKLRADIAQARREYQSASIVSTSAFSTSRWVVQQLRELRGVGPGCDDPPRVLEVGAINDQLLSTPWLNVRALDLMSRHPKIEERDFFTVPPAQHFHVLVNSMVINSVPDPAQRGCMLRRCHDHLRPGGLLFLILPKRCVRASPFVTLPFLRTAMARCGLSTIRTHATPRVVFLVAQRAHDAPRALLLPVDAELLPKSGRRAKPTPPQPWEELAALYPLPPPPLKHASQPGKKLGCNFSIAFSEAVR